MRHPKACDDDDDTDPNAHDVASCKPNGNRLAFRPRIGLPKRRGKSGAGAKKFIHMRMNGVEALRFQFLADPNLNPE